MLCCKALEIGLKHLAIKADDIGCYEVLSDGCKQYFLECPFCGQEMKHISKNVNDSIYVGKPKLQAR